MAAKGFNIMPLIGMALAGGVGYFFFKKKNNIFNKNFHSLKMKIVGINKHENDLVLNIKVLNPTSSTMEIKSIVGNILFSGIPSGDIKMFSDYKSQGNSEIQIPLIIQPKKGAKITGNISLRGKINVNDHSIPLSLNFKK